MVGCELEKVRNEASGFICNNKEPSAPLSDGNSPQTSGGSELYNKLSHRLEKILLLIRRPLPTRPHLPLRLSLGPRTLPISVTHQLSSKYKD